jgi:predicted Fe-Mo cluster-binding NifX family protein
LLLTEGVSLVITGGIEQPVLDELKEKGLEVIRGASGKCEEVLKKYLASKLDDQNICCSHHGEIIISPVPKFNKKKPHLCAAF